MKLQLLPRFGKLSADLKTSFSLASIPLTIPMNEGAT
jgi:hypothetical protein